MANPQRVHRARFYYWLYTLFFVAGLLVFRAWQPLGASAGQHRYTFLLNDPPGTPAPGNLTTDRWSWNFVLDMLLVLLWLVPISGVLMTSYVLKSGFQVLHTVVVVLLLFWYVFTLVYMGVTWYATANDAGAANALNPANDPRWCCIYAASVSKTVCPNKGEPPCEPPVGANMLIVNPGFMFRFWGTFVFCLLLVADLFLTWLVVWRASTDYARQIAADVNGNNVEQADVERRIPINSISVNPRNIAIRRKLRV